MTLVTSCLAGLLAPGIASPQFRQRVFIVGLVLTVAGFVVLVTPLYLPSSLPY
jgi:hypothetical protein